MNPRIMEKVASVRERNRALLQRLMGLSREQEASYLDHGSLHGRPDPGAETLQGLRSHSPSHVRDFRRFFTRGR